MANSILGYTSPDNYANSQNVNFTPTTSPIAQQKSDYNQFNNDFTSFLGGQATVPQIQQKYQNKYNIPYLQDTAQKQNNLAQMDTNALTALPGSVNSSTANSLLTQGQKDRIMQSQAAPIGQRLNQENTAAGITNQTLGTAQTNQSNMVGAEQAQQMKMTQPWLQKYDAMTIANAAANTQWSQQNEMELQRLLSNQQSGVALSNAEQGRLATLAQQAGAFQNALDVANTNKSAEIAKAQIGNQYQITGPGQNLINTFTNTATNPGILTGSKGYYQGR